MVFDDHISSNYRLSFKSFLAVMCQLGIGYMAVMFWLIYALRRMLFCDYVSNDYIYSMLTLFNDHFFY